VKETVTYVEMTARALPNYHRRGFRTFKTVQVEQD
jgi:hypothetical protein